MPIPRIAIIGRPNVGKSSLLNLIARDKISIVDPTAGTTRDRVSAVARLTPPMHGEDTDKAIHVEVTDTGGFGVYVEDGRRFDDVGKDLTSLTDDIEFQIAQAVAGADLVLFVVDSQAGITAADRRVAKLLRERVLGSRTASARGRGGKKGGKGKKAADVQPADGDDAPTPPPEHPVRVRVIANKTDGPRWEAHAYEAAALGFGPPIPVSAKNNYFRRDFLDALYEELAQLPNVIIGEPPETPGLKIAIIGKRNAGKSTLVNALAGEERVIVSEIAGTTRDAVDVRVQLDGREFTVIDTAGLRKKKSFADRIEWFAFDRAQRSIERADVVLMLVDATEPLSQIDQQLMKLVQSSFKPCVIVVNKWDLAEGRAATTGSEKKGHKQAGWRKGQALSPGMYEDYLREETKGLDFAPLAFVSAERKSGVRECINLAFELYEQAGMRASTGQLNRLLKRILETRGPSSKLGTFAKTYFISQVAVRPPTIVLVVNKPELFTPNYQRFLLNRLRDALEFPEVPIKLIIKERRRARIEDLLSGEHQRLKEAGQLVVEEDVGAEVESVDADVASPEVGPAGPIVELRGKNRRDAKRRAKGELPQRGPGPEIEDESDDADEPDADDFETEGDEGVEFEVETESGDAAAAEDSGEDTESDDADDAELDAIKARAAVLDDEGDDDEPAAAVDLDDLPDDAAAYFEDAGSPAGGPGKPSKPGPRGKPGPAASPARKKTTKKPTRPPGKRGGGGGGGGGKRPSGGGKRPQR